jgi:arylsulfatase A-like enzyme
MRPRRVQAWCTTYALVLGGLLPILTSARAVGDEGRPNVVFVLVDDMGYADVGCYGAKDIRTPNVDRLAREGVRMTDFYSNGPVCSPTRCGFITGRWQQRAGLEWALGITSQCLVRDGQGQGRGPQGSAAWRPEPDFKRFGLPAAAAEPTIARLLGDAGYATACIGKWHLGWRPENSPAAHGFAEAFGIYGGNADLYSHRGRDGVDDLYENGRPVREEGYLTELLTRRAVRFIEQNRERPFFLYVPFNAVHWPFQPPGRPDLVRSYATWYEGDRRVYAQMVEAIDAGVGAIRAALERAGTLDRTLFVFSNDNGGEVRLTSNRPLFHHKATVWEGGIRVPCILRWPGHLPAGVESHQVGITMDLTATFLAACGVRPPSDHPLDGIDLVPILAGRQPETIRTLGWRIDRIERKQKALRHGKWKLVVDGPHDVVKHELLFDLDSDISERFNVAYEHPDVLADLRHRLEAWEADVDSRPLPFVVK